MAGDSLAARNGAVCGPRRGAASPLAGQTLREVARPPNPLVVAVGHAGEIIFPRATTRLALGEVVQIMAEPAGEPAWRAFLEGTPARPGSGPKGWTRSVSRAAPGRSGGEEVRPKNRSQGEHHDE